MNRPSFVGWFEGANIAHDPGRAAPCPYCGEVIGDGPVSTTSLTDGTMSLFYRAHRDCAHAATEDQETDVDTIALGTVS